MTGPSRPAARAARTWAAWYTAGLPDGIGAERRAEIDSDLDDHLSTRRREGQSARRTGREVISRTLRGVPADLAWRHDVLARTYRSNALVRSVVLLVATVSTLAVAAFIAAFAVYLLGVESLAHRAGLGGLDHYADKIGTVDGTAVGVIALALGGLLVAACAARPVAPLTANVAIVPIAIWTVLWFWLGAAPIGLICIAATMSDLLIRAPAARPAR